jgi:hypothetical protein
MKPVHYGNVLGYLSRELVDEALHSVDDMDGFLKFFRALPEKEFRRALNQAWEVAHTEHLFRELLEQAGAGPEERKMAGLPHVPMNVLGAALTIITIASQRGLNPPAAVLKRVRGELATSLIEFGARYHGKLTPIDAAKTKAAAE